MRRADSTTLHAALVRLVRVAEACGIVPPPERAWHLEPGCGTYGRGYRLHWMDKRSGAEYPAGHLPDFLGRTRGEALQTLWTIAATLDAAARVREVEP